MPVPASTYAGSAPVTAKQLNSDLYTYTPGNNHTPNGILFHAQRPLLVEAVTTTGLSQASSSGGATTSYVSGGTWKGYYDSAVLFGGGADLPGLVASGQLLATVPGSTGAAGSAGGYYLVWGWPTIAPATNAGGFGAFLDENGTDVAGAKQLSSTTRDNSAYVMDLFQPSGTTDSSLAGYCADTSGSSFTVRNNTIDYSGDVTRFYGMWCGVSTGGGTASTVPAPQTSWAAGSAVTSTLLNGLSGIGGPLNFLNNPPMLRAANLNSTSITTSTVTTVPLTGDTSGTQIDSYSGLSGSTYTVPVAGVYLVHATVNYGANTGSNRMCGVQINGSLNLWGPAYQAAGTGGTAPQMTRLLDLHAGDTVKLITEQNSGGTLTLASGQPCRLVLVWVAALPTGATLTWTPPATGFRWQAGTPGAQLPGLFQAHLANDLNFLIDRPVLMTYQGTQQTGLTFGTSTTITMDTVTGRVHGTAGDNYDGWTTGASNLYTAPVAGWYLAVAGYSNTETASTISCLAAILQNPPGVITPDYYQHVRSTSVAWPPGAEAVGMYYLRAGDTIQPQYEVQDGSGTWSTAAPGTWAGSECHFEAVWISN